MELQHLNINNFTYFDYLVVVIIAFLLAHLFYSTILLANRKSKIESLTDKVNNLVSQLQGYREKNDKWYNLFQKEKDNTARLRAIVLNKEDIIEGLKRKAVKTIPDVKPVEEVIELDKKEISKLPRKKGFQGKKRSDQQGS